MGLESLDRNRTKKLLAFFVEQFSLRRCLAPQLTLQVLLTVIRQSDIQHPGRLRVELLFEEDF